MVVVSCTMMITPIGFKGMKGRGSDGNEAENNWWMEVDEKQLVFPLASSDRVVPDGYAGGELTTGGCGGGKASEGEDER